MTNELQVFNFEDKQTRTIEENGEIWFVAKDVAEILEYSEASLESPNKLFAHIPSIWTDRKRFLVRSENGVEQEREMLCLTEQGLYFFLGRSDKKKAIPYQMWVAGKVVPSIRKHGMYATPQKIEEMLEDPDTLIKTLQALKAEREKSAELEKQKSELEAQAEEDKPKVVFANSVSASENSILIGSLAKILCQNGIKIGPIKLFESLRQHGFLISQKGERWNMPTQRSLEMKLFEIKESVMQQPDGKPKTYYTTKVTGKGQIYFVNYFKKIEKAMKNLRLSEEFV